MYGYGGRGELVRGMDGAGGVGDRGSRGGGGKMGRLLMVRTGPFLSLHFFSDVGWGLWECVGEVCTEEGLRGIGWGSRGFCEWDFTELQRREDGDEE